MIMDKGDKKKQSSSLTGLFVRLQSSNNSYVASYAPIATRLNTNKNSAQYWTIIYFQLPNYILLTYAT